MSFAWESAATRIVQPNNNNGASLATMLRILLGPPRLLAPFSFSLLFLPSRPVSPGERVATMLSNLLALIPVVLGATASM